MCLANVFIVLRTREPRHIVTAAFKTHTHIGIHAYTHKKG